MFSMPPTRQTTQAQARPVTANSYMNRQPSGQPARFDRETSSIIVPTVHGMAIALYIGRMKY
jgi:hypothetical protein